MKISRVLIAVLCALALTLAIRDISAGSGTITTPAVFDADWTAAGGVASFVNAAACTSYGLPSSCTTAQLQAAGCAPVAISKDVKTGLAVFAGCQIYAATGAGELVWAQDVFNASIVTIYNNWTAAKNRQWCTDYKAGTITISGASAGEVPPCQ